MWDYEYDRQLGPGYQYTVPGYTPVGPSMPFVGPGGGEPYALPWWMYGLEMGPQLPAGQIAAPDQTGYTPPSPPPSFTPQKTTAQTLAVPGATAVNPAVIMPCRFRFVYIWLDSGYSFWTWLIFVGPTSVAGFVWTGRNWRYFSVDLRRIDAFVCY